MGTAHPWRSAASSLALPLVLLAAPASAQYLGVPQCKKCHGLAERAFTKYHQRTLAQLSGPKSKTFAAAVGGNPMDPRCVDCHTAVRVGGGGDPVTCESCHGAGGVYLKPHQKAAWAGMTPLFNDATAVARLCVECHVLSAQDGNIAAAGHPTGRDFPFGDKLKLLKHWPSDENELTRPRTYDAAFYAKVAATAAPQVARRAGAGPVKTAGAAIPPARAAPVPPPDDEYADLADDEFRNPAARAPAPSAARPKAVRALSRSPAPDEVPTYPEAPVGALSPTLDATSSPKEAGRLDVPALRGRAAVALERLVREKKAVPLESPRPPASFQGADSELLLLQDEVMALALELLSKGPQAQEPDANGRPRAR
jgi:hypothetical protein